MAVLAYILAQRGDISFRPNLEGFIALAAGIVILIAPKTLNYVVAAWLIVFGLIRLFNVSI
jgi:Protein of unknown function (DUF3096)